MGELEWDQLLYLEKCVSNDLGLASRSKEPWNKIQFARDTHKEICVALRNKSKSMCLEGKTRFYDELLTDRGIKVA